IHEARLHAAMGDRTAAKEAFEQLLDVDDPRGEVHLLYARLLSEGDATDQRAALDVWQQIERRSKPAGDRWLEARRTRIALFEQLGQHEQATKLRRITKLLYPQ